MTQFQTERAVGATNVGRRNHNEDAYLLRPKSGLVLVADGVGGHHAGEVASAITCNTIADEVTAGAGLQQAVRAANRAVMEAVRTGNGKQGMASTVVAASVDEEGFEVAWVGDSRAYLWDGQLKLLTRDHSLLERLLASGEITRDEVKDHPQRNVIIQAIGLQSEDSLRVDINGGSLPEGAILLLCSDGMSDVLENAEIAAILCRELPLQERCDLLVETSIANGGKDNSTVILVSGNGPVTEHQEPNVVWRYDPSTGAVEGLTEATAAAPQLRKVGPKAAAEDSESPRTTQMMSVADVEKELARRGQSSSNSPAAQDADTAPAKIPGWLIGVATAVIVIAASVMVFLNRG